MDAPILSPREAFRQAVADVAAKAKAKLPDCSGRIDSAVKIVLTGDVELLPDGGARVASRSDAHLSYLTVNSRCECRDFARAPEGLCAHRLAYGIMRRASELVPLPRGEEPQPVQICTPAQAPAAPLPEAPASVNVHIMVAGRQVQLTLRDSDETRLLQRLEAVLKRFPLEPAPAAALREGWCQMHQVPMRQTTKNGRTWYSHRVADGSWCKGKGGR